MPSVDRPPRVNIVGVGIAAISLSQACDLIEAWVRDGGRHYICVCPAHSLVEALRDPAYRRVLNHADLATPDGMPLVWLARRAGFPEVTRVYGPDLVLALCARSAGWGLRHYFYGGRPGVSEGLASRLRRRFPDLQVVGASTPPFRELTPRETEEQIARLNAAEPDIIWVGLGAPKQDFWMARHRARLTAPVLAGVGAAFDFLAGTKLQAPPWMRERGLEWLFRLITEPRRLWRRYLLTGPVFVWHAVLQSLGLKEYRFDV